MNRPLFLLLALCLCLAHTKLEGKYEDIKWTFTGTQVEEENADSRPTTYVKTEIRLQAGKENVFNFKAVNDKLQVNALKVSGQAAGWIEVYVNNALKKRLQFNAESRNLSRNWSIEGIKNKSIRIKVLHKAGSQDFHYKLTCTGHEEIKKIEPNKSCPRGYTSGTVQAGQPKVLTMQPVCNQIEFIIQRTGGGAAAEIIIYLDNIWTSKIEFPKGVNTTQKKKLYPLNGRTIRMEITNKGAQGSTFQYKMQSIQSN